MDDTLVLAVDFDGVLHDPHDKEPGYKLGKPIKGAKEAMSKLKNEGAIIGIFSVWADTDTKRKAMSEWLRYFEIPYDFITNIKGNATFYIDDNALRFTSWEQTLKDIKELRPGS